MYKVIGTYANRALRVLWMMEELSQDFEFILAQPRSDEAKQYSPFGKVPILQDEDAIITDSVAILTYLADKHGQFTFPAGTLARAEQDSYTQFIVEELEGPLWTAAKHSFVLPEEYRVPEAKNACRYEWDIAIERLEQRLQGNPYLMGDTFTIADILVCHCLLWAGKAKFEIKSKAVQKYLAGILARPAATKCMSKLFSQTSKA
ncbi:glutathione S-transferase family protein [Polycladidibacter hongkongensis]|uniref:glutathione S-transferase family protein n=1 Tax=Polycladidibacter hongkongensis TaxID=1647556 RepID=UPI0008319289|nr:glutathione S-transferase family protein [Pseudovibrio hongkongensis]